MTQIAENGNVIPFDFKFLPKLTFSFLVQVLLNKFHPPRPDWYEELYAWVLNSATKSYEAEVFVNSSCLLNFYFFYMLVLCFC